jgi:hypothetical protein
MNGMMCCRRPSHVHLYAWAEEESSLKVQEGVEWQPILLFLLLLFTLFLIVFWNFVGVKCKSIFKNGYSDHYQIKT